MIKKFTTTIPKIFYEMKMIEFLIPMIKNIIFQKNNNDKKC